MYCTILICYDFGIFVLKKVKKRAENLEMTINSVTFAKDIKQYFLKQLWTETLSVVISATSVS